MNLIKGNQELLLTLDEFYTALNSKPHGKVGDKCIFCDNESNNFFHQMCNEHTDQYRKLRVAAENKRFEAKRLELGIDYDKLEDLEVDGIDHGDYPDYVDAFISDGYMDGKELTDEQLEFLSDDRDLVDGLVQDRVQGE